MRKEQLILQIIEKLQQLTEAQLSRVTQFITGLLDRNQPASYQLPEESTSNIINEPAAKYLSDFKSRLQALTEDQLLTLAIMQLAGQSASYQFLTEEEDLYTIEDLQEVYHA